MSVAALKDQLNIRKKIDGRKDVLLSPPKGSEDKARKWMILKLQSLLQDEFKVGNMVYGGGPQ